MEKLRVLAEEQENSKQNKSEYDDGENGGSDFEGFGLLQSPFGAFPFGIHEGREFFIGREDGIDIFFEFESEPFAGQGAPEQWEFASRFRVRLSEADLMPERRLLESPNAKQPVICGNGFEAFPQKGPKRVGERKIRKEFRMQMPCFSAICMPMPPRIVASADSTT